MATNRLKAGVSEIEITGKAGLELACELNMRKSSGIGTPLMARALVLSDSRETLVIVTLDLIGLMRETGRKIVNLISERVNCKPESVMLVASHTRGAPYTAPVVGWDGLHQGYIEEIIPKIVDAADESSKRLQNASLGLGQARLPHLIYNHRLMTRNMKAISAWMGIPQNEVLEPEGPVDPEFSVVVIRDGNGDPVCLLWSFAADIRFNQDDQMSAGLPYYVQQELDRRAGRHIPCLYLTGCGGNVSYIHDFEKSVEMVTSGIMALQLETSCDPLIALGCDSEEMVLPIRDYTEYWSKPDIELKKPDVVDVYAHEIELMQKEGAEAVPTSISVFRLGRYALAGLPGMPFVEMALDIKRNSQFQKTLVLGNVNDYPGFVITRQAFEDEGFESWPSRSARIGPGGAEFMGEEAVRMLNGLVGK